MDDADRPAVPMCKVAHCIAPLALPDIHACCRCDILNCFMVDDSLLGGAGCPADHTTLAPSQQTHTCEFAQQAPEPLRHWRWPVRCNGGHSEVQLRMNSNFKLHQRHPRRNGRSPLYGFMIILPQLFI